MLRPRCALTSTPLQERVWVPVPGCFPGEWQPVPLARARLLLGNSPQRWGEPRQARARRPGPPPSSAQSASSATTQRPDSLWVVGVPGLPTPRLAHPATLTLLGDDAGGSASLYGPPDFPQKARSWLGATGTRPPWSSLLHESVLVEVVITPLFGRAAPSSAGRRTAAAPFASYRV